MAAWIFMIFSSFYFNLLVQSYKLVVHPQLFSPFYYFVLVVHDLLNSLLVHVRHVLLASHLLLRVAHHALIRVNRLVFLARVFHQHFCVVSLLNMARFLLPPHFCWLSALVGGFRLVVHFIWNCLLSFKLVLEVLPFFQRFKIMQAEKVNVFWLIFKHCQSEIVHYFWKPFRHRIFHQVVWSHQFKLSNKIIFTSQTFT